MVEELLRLLLPGPFHQATELANLLSDAVLQVWMVLEGVCLCVFDHLI